MFIKSIVKTDVVTEKMYEYLCLCEIHRIGNKSRHKNIISKKTIANEYVKLENQVDGNFQTIELETLSIEQVREIGSEWLCYQALEQLGFSKFL